ncbi:MAG: acyl-CoA dehydrogenase [Myxococcota bacterium]|nr:acyl-CoA dehydrogenase [Myxococcota bacterium]
MTPPALTDLHDDEKMFQEAITAFAQDRIAPKVAAMDEASQVDPALFEELFQMGLMGIEIPEKFGGAGSSFFSAILAIEALAKVDASVSVVADVQNTLVNNAILRWGNDEQKAKYLPKMTSEWIGSYALSEAGSGSDAFALKTRAERRGDHYVLNGTKLWITNGGEASLFIVMANVDPSQGYKGITSFLVEKGSPGFEIGKKEDKLGIRASSTVELNFNDCPVPVENVLGDVGVGYKIAIETLNEGRIGIGAQMVGLAQGAFDYAMNYMLERKQFGRPIAEFQGLEFQYAELATEIEAARLMVYNAARLKDSGRSFLKEAAMAKLFASQVAEKASSQCIGFCGGVGFTKEYPLEKYYRDAKIGTIYEGTSNMQLATIAKLLRRAYQNRIG